MNKSIADAFMEFSFPHFPKEVTGGQDVDANGIKMSAGYDAADLNVVKQNHSRSADMNIFDK